MARNHAEFIQVTASKEYYFVLTDIGPRYADLRVVVERLEEVFVGYLDVAHPVQQVLRPGVVDCKLDERSSHGHVRRAFGHVDTVRRRAFAKPAYLVLDPRISEPVREVVTAANYVYNVKYAS